MANGGVCGFPSSGGAVGYQPVITTLPEGAMMSATAVISADRRYVRITPTPLFSGVSQVNTFNMATGTQRHDVTGGTGNQGYSGSSFGSSGHQRSRQQRLLSCRNAFAVTALVGVAVVCHANARAF